MPDIIYGCDISNWQRSPYTSPSYRDTDWYKDSSFVIVQAIAPTDGYPGADHTDLYTLLPGYTGEQLVAARDDGKKVGIYTFTYWGTDPHEDTHQRLKCIPPGFKLDFRVWQDVEDENAAFPDKAYRREHITIVQAELDTWSANEQPHLWVAGKDAGIYSRDQYIKDELGGWFPESTVYWQCAPGRDPTELLHSRPVRQYQTNPVDLDSMLTSELVSLDIQAPPDPGTPVDVPLPDPSVLHQAVDVALQRWWIEAAKRSPTTGKLTPLSRKIMTEIFNDLHTAWMS